MTIGEIRTYPMFPGISPIPGPIGQFKCPKRFCFFLPSSISFVCFFFQNYFFHQCRISRPPYTCFKKRIRKKCHHKIITVYTTRGIAPDFAKILSSPPNIRCIQFVWHCFIFYNAHAKIGEI